MLISLLRVLIRSYQRQMQISVTLKLLSDLSFSLHQRSEVCLNWDGSTLALMQRSGLYRRSFLGTPAGGWPEHVRRLSSRTSVRADLVHSHRSEGA